MPNIDPTKIAMPLTDLELLNLPLSSVDIGMLQTILADFKKRKPFKGFNPVFERLETKVNFMFCTVLVLSGDEEMVAQGTEALLRLHATLLKQKEILEQTGAAGGEPGDGVR